MQVWLAEALQRLLLDDMAWHIRSKSFDMAWLIRSKTRLISADQYTPSLQLSLTSRAKLHAAFQPWVYQINAAPS